MRLKDLYTVPEGQKITERALARVLISSICSILLCMTCLVGATWAWFTVDIENPNNVIEIASVTNRVTIVNEEGVSLLGEGPYELPVGTYSTQVNVESTATERHHPVYVIMTVTYKGAIQYFYIEYAGNENLKTLPVTVHEEEASLNFEVSWVAPAATTAKEVNVEGIVLGEPPEEPVEPPEEEQEEEQEPVEPEVPAETPEGTDEEDDADTSEESDENDQTDEQEPTDETGKQEEQNPTVDPDNQDPTDTTDTPADPGTTEDPLNPSETPTDPTNPTEPTQPEGEVTVDPTEDEEEQQTIEE